MNHTRNWMRSPRRQTIRNYWHDLRDRLREHIAQHPKGEAAIMAKHIGMKQSQVHRYLCPKCEHDAEPCYSIGRALEDYLANHQSIKLNSPSEHARNGKVTHRTIFQISQARKRRTIKLVEVIRTIDGSWETIQLN